MCQRDPDRKWLLGAQGAEVSSMFSLQTGVVRLVVSVLRGSIYFLICPVEETIISDLPISELF